MRALSVPRSTSAWEWGQAALLMVNLGWTTLCLGGYRPETLVVTSALTAALLAVHFIAHAFGDETVHAGENAAEVAPRPTRRSRRLTSPFHPAAWALVPFVIYAAINVQWVTPVPWIGWRDWFGWAQMVAVFWVVLNGLRSAGPRKAVFLVLVGLGVVGTAMAAYQRFVRPDWLMLGRVQAEQFFGRASGSFGIPNSLGAFLLLVLPATGALAWRPRARLGERVAWTAVTLVLGFGLVLSISRGAWLGLALALAAWPLFGARRKWWQRLALAGGAAAAVIATSALIIAVVPPVRQRFVQLVQEAGERTRPIMWRVAWRLWEEHPFTGTGAGSYNVLFERYRPEGFTNEPQWAHNDYINTLSDYGAVGFVLFFGAAAAIAVVAMRRGARQDGADVHARFRAAAGMPRVHLQIELEPRPAAESGPHQHEPTGALAVGLLAFFLQLFVDFHFKIPALAMAAATCAGLVVSRTWPMRRHVRPRLPARVGCAMAALALGAIFAGGFVPRFRAEGLRYAARQAIDQFALQQTSVDEYARRLGVIRGQLGLAVALDPANADAWADSAFAISLQPYAEPGRQSDPAWMHRLGREAEVAADHAIELSGARAEFWIRRGVARDMEGRWLEAGDDFTQAIQLAPANPVAWYYDAYHLSLNSHERDLALAALAFCLRLDPANPDGLRLRQRLAIGLRSP